MLSSSLRLVSNSARGNQQMLVLKMTIIIIDVRCGLNYGTLCVRLVACNGEAV